MLIPNINQAHALPPIQAMLEWLKKVRNASTALELMTSNAGATSYLAALRDTSYITSKEHYEYTRQLADNFGSRNVELNNVSK